MSELNKDRKQPTWAATYERELAESEGVFISDDEAQARAAKSRADFISEHKKRHRHFNSDLVDVAAGKVEKAPNN